MTDKQAEMLPCPFCGGEASLFPKGFSNARPTCLDCGVSTHSLNQWNHRPAPAPMDAEREKALAAFTRWINQNKRKMETARADEATYNLYKSSETIRAALRQQPAAQATPIETDDGACE